MSIWSDIHKRSNGVAVRKEDTAMEEDNKWEFYVNNKWNSCNHTYIKNEIDNLIKENNELNKQLEKFKNKLKQLYR